VFIVCVFLCTVFRLIVVLFCVMCVVYVLCLIVVPLPPGENPFAVKINIYLSKSGYEGVTSVHLDWNSNQRLVLMNKALNFRVPYIMRFRYIISATVRFFRVYLLPIRYSASNERPDLLVLEMSTLQVAEYLQNAPCFLHVK
jgi:hypothetical protein